MYGSIDGIMALAPAVGTIDNDSTPNTGQVEEWLAEGAALIHGALAGAGYAVPAARTAGVYPSLRALNNLYAAAYTLRARGLDVVQGREETRSEIYLKDFFDRLKILASQDLTALGLILRTTPSLATRRGVRSMQLRRVDGYSAAYSGLTDEPDSVSE
jgi:hypothetical protein